MNFYLFFFVIVSVTTDYTSNYVIINCSDNYIIHVPVNNIVNITSSYYIDCTPSNSDNITTNVTQCIYYSCNENYNISVTISDYEYCTNSLNNFSIYYYFTDEYCNITIVYVTRLTITIIFCLLSTILVCILCYICILVEVTEKENVPLLNNGSSSRDNSLDYTEILHQIEKV